MAEKIIIKNDINDTLTRCHDTHNDYVYGNNNDHMNNYTDTDSDNNGDEDNPDLGLGR